MAFYGDKGVPTIGIGGYTIYDPQSTQAGQGSGDSSDMTHIQSFLDAVRDGRLGRTVPFDATTRAMANDQAATALWGEGWG
jgi:hypothetical protein